MFDMISIGETAIEILVEAMSLNDIHWQKDLSSDIRSRRIKIDANVNLYEQTIEFNLNYRSKPKTGKA